MRLLTSTDAEQESHTRGELETLLALVEDPALGPEHPAAAERTPLDPAALQALERQRHVTHALRSGGPVPPPELAIRLAAMMEGSRGRRRPPARSPWFAMPLAASAVAAIAIAVVLTSILSGWGGGASNIPTAQQFASAWTRPANGPPVAPSPAHPGELDVSYHGVAYPNYHDREGWHPTSARYDTIAGIRTMTVFYEVGRRRAAYTVVPLTAVPVPATARRLRVAGLSLREFRDGNRWIVTFERNGSTCVLTAAAPRERHWLLLLAAWRSAPTTRPV